MRTQLIKNTKATSYLTRLLCLISLLTLAACGGGGSDELTPEIISFSASSTSITAGENVDITVTFDGGTGTVDNLVGEISSGTSFNISPSETTTYTLTVEEPRGSSVTQSVTITVVAVTEIVSFTSSADTITAGESVDLTAEFTDGGSTAEIDNEIGAISSLTPVTVSPTETTTYVLTVTPASGDTISSSITVNVTPTVTTDTTVIASPLPTITSFTATATTISLGDSVDLTAVFADGTGNIDNSVSAVTSGVAETVSPTTTTTYTLTVTNDDGETATSSTTITVVSLPTASLAGTTTISVGDNTDLTSTYNGGTASIAGIGNIASSSDTSNVSPTTTTTYTLTVINAAGATAQSSVTVTVVALPTASLAGTITISDGDDTDLTSTFSGGIASIAGIGNIASSSDTSNVSPTSTTTYTLIVTNAAGATAQSSVTVTVVALPTASLTVTATGTDTASITASENIDLTSTFSGGIASIAGIGNIASSSDTSNISPTTTTTYTLTVTNAAGAIATSPVTVTVISLPTASLVSDSGSGIVTPGDSVILTADYTTDGSVIPNIDQSVGDIETPGETNTVNPTTTTTYTLTVENSLGFEVTSSITLLVTEVTGTPLSRPIANNADIEIIFNRSMDAAGTHDPMILGGDLVGEVASTTWGNHFFGTNNKLTISPTTGAWTSTGTNKTLTVVADDSFGTTSDVLTFNFDIAAGTVHIVDSYNGGTKQTIRDKLALASSGDIIAVNDGTYSDATPIDLIDGVMLLGGYEQYFTSKGGNSVIVDTSATATSLPATPNSVIRATGALSSATIVDGFTLKGSTDASADYTSAILLPASGANPTIQNNIIDGGSGTSTSYGIYTTSSDPIIRNNLVSGGTSTNSYGVNINEATSTFTLRNNTISAGTGSTIAYGVSNSTIPSTGTSSTPKIENNIIFSAGSGASKICFYEADSTSRPDSMNNNYLLNCSTALYRDGNSGCTGTDSACTLAEMESLTFGTSVGGNIDDADPTFANFTDIDGAGDIAFMDDNDWHISNTNPASAAGINGTSSWGYTLDLNGVTRPTSGGWSIGAYEP